MSRKIFIVAMLVVGGLCAFIFISKQSHPTTSTIIDPTATTDNNQTVPPAIPSHVPLYPDAVLANSQENSSATEKNFTLSLTTTDTVTDINTWYRGALNQNGWAVTKEQNIGGYILFEGENENIKVFVQAANMTDNTVTITERIRIRE